MGTLGVIGPSSFGVRERTMTCHVSQRRLTQIPHRKQESLDLIRIVNMRESS